MNTFRVSLMVFMSLFFITASAQQAATQSTDFSLQAAIDYALKHNPTQLNAELDVQMADDRRREYVGIGLPQISGSADLKDYIEIPTVLIPASAFGGPADQFIAAKFGTQYNAQAGVSVSQIIFNTDYLVAIKASKELTALAEKNLARTRVETIAAVTKAYYTALINKKRIEILDANIVRVKRLFDETKVLNENGFVDKVDLDRIELLYNNLVTDKERVDRLTGITLTLLKFQMGYDVKLPINLTDELKADMLVDVETLTDLKVNYDARNEYGLLLSQERLNKIELQRYRYQYFPSLVAYGSYMQQAFRTKFDIFSFSETAKWFPVAIIGATLNVPIFDGGQKHYKIQQAKLNLKKSTNSITNLKSVIDMEVYNTSTIYKNAYSSMLTQKKNRVLAESVYETTKKKYQAGLGTNLEVVTAETELKTAETNYLNAIFELLIAKVEMDKALGNIK